MKGSNALQAFPVIGSEPPTGLREATVTIADAAYRLGVKVAQSDQLELERDEMDVLIQDYMNAYYVRKRPTLTVVDDSYWHRSEATRLLRRGIAWFVVLAVAGMLLMTMNKGIGLSVLLSGMLIFMVYTYGHGLRTGDYLISPRYAVLGIMGLLVLIATALVATVEGFSRV